MSTRRYVLEQILSGENTENVIEHIHEYLTTMGEDVRAGKIKPDEFIIFKVSASSASHMSNVHSPRGQ